MKMKKQALLIIDMLNDFVEDWGSLKVKNAKSIIDNIKKKIEEVEFPIIYVCDSHREKDPEFELFPVHAVENTEGSKIIKELTPKKTDFVVLKRRYSGFFQTQLDLLLRELKVEELILTGLVTEICIYHTAADAYFRGYKLIIPKDCVIGLSKEAHDLALKNMQNLFAAKII
jgi:nicotinamidase-related amidase